MTAAAALFARPAPAAGGGVACLARQPASTTSAARRALAVASIGGLVPCSWIGRVHSVFARACNVESGELLLTIGAPGIGDGPTTLVLARDAGDLRRRFTVGERVAARDGWIRSARVELELAGARVWQPLERGPRVPHAELDARLRAVGACLAARRARQANVLDRDAAPVAAALAAACASLDLARASAAVDRLIGWGEGLTPAGDDFIVGLLAALADATTDANAAHHDAADAPTRRVEFRAALAARVVAATTRTTAIAAHALRLAARGAWSEPIDRLLVALCHGDDGRAADAAVAHLLAFGASSGADTASGIVAALCAWSRAPTTAEVA